MKKVIGIISYFPDSIREERIRRFERLMGVLNELFKTPIIIIAQNWKDADIDKLNAYTNQEIKVYQYGQLGITKARIILRDKFLESDFDILIPLDDDSDIITTKDGVEDYFSQIDGRPNHVGFFRYDWMRLMSIPRIAYERLSYGFISNYESIRGEIWEDVAWGQTYKTLYPGEWFNFNRSKIDEVSITAYRDDFTTWMEAFPMNQRRSVDMQVGQKTRVITDNWVDFEKRRMGCK